MRKGDVWLINLDPTIGAEIKKTRPAVIVSEDAIGVLPLKVVVPVTDWKDRYAAAPWMVRLEPDTQNKLVKTSAADCFQVRSVSQERFIRLVGSLPRLRMVETEIAPVSSARQHISSFRLARLSCRHQSEYAALAREDALAYRSFASDIFTNYMPTRSTGNSSPCHPRHSQRIPSDLGVSWRGVTNPSCFFLLYKLFTRY